MPAPLVRNLHQGDAFAFAPGARRIIYTSNAIESLRSRASKAVFNRGHFPNNRTVSKLKFQASGIVGAERKTPCSRLASGHDTI